MGHYLAHGLLRELEHPFDHRNIVVLQLARLLRFLDQHHDLLRGVDALDFVNCSLHAQQSHQAIRAEVEEVRDRPRDP